MGDAAGTRHERITIFEAGDGIAASDSPYVAVLELAFVRTVQRIRHLSETRLLYEISLRLGSTLDLSQLLDEVPKPGAGGAKVAFIHPKGAQGVLTELREGPKK